MTIEKVRGSSGNPSIDPFAASPGGYVGPAGAGFVRARSSQPLAVTPGSRKQVLQLQSPQTLNTSSQQQAELASSIDCWAPFDAASPTHHHGAGVPIPTQQQRHARSSLADCMVLPSRGNNAEQEDAMHGSYTPGTGTDTAAALAAASRSPTGGSFADPNQRKRSVTVAVVGHPDPALSPSRDGADLKRRVTHAGNISAGSTPHQQHFPQLQSTSEGGSLVLGSDKQEATFAHKPLGGYDYSNATAVVVAHSLLPIQEASSPKAVPKINTSNLSLRNPLGAAMVQEGQEETFQKQPPAIADASAAAAMASGSESASASDSFTPQSIIKQRSSFSSDVGGSAKKPSQIIRVASEGHTKTLSFDSTFEDDNSSGVGVGAGSASPNSPANSSRPRNGSYEIIYQETPEERMRMQQMQPEVIFQATPSPHLSRKRAQSTPLHLLLSSPQPRQQQPQIDSPTVYSPAAPIHVSQSLSTLSHYPTFSQPASSAAASSPQAILRSAPAYPVRKVYQGKEGAGGSSQVSTPSPNPRKNYSASKSRLFSARRRERAASAAEGEGGEGAGGEGCDVMETFGMLDTLSKPFTRGESMAESQMIHIALRSMRVEGSTVAGMAARKISVWWRLIAPRKKLLRRMAVREVCRDIVHAMVDSAFLIGTTKQRRHRSLLRNGAAMKIQRCFRFWSNTIMAEERRLEQEERSRIAWRGLSLWANCVMAAIRIYRYVRYCQRRRRGRTPIKLNSSQLLRRTIEKYFVVRTMRKKLELQKDLYTKMKIASMLSHNHSSGRNNLYREREMAVVCIQKAFRAYNLHKQLMERQYFNIMCSKITYFFIRWIARRRVKLNKIKKQAATVIQTFFRGIHIRRRILKIVESGLRLNALWRKHKAYVSLKSQLRRVDRPHTLIMHGIRNISKKTINADHMRFKVSVWWHPLLHIVSQNDFNTIIQSKQPQFIYNSQAFYLVDTAEQKIHRRMSISQGLRKLSSILTTTNRKQSTAHDELPLVNTASKGVFRYSQVLANKSSSLSATARASMASFVGAVSGSGSRQSTYIKALPPIGPPSQQSSSTSSFSKGQSLPGSLLRPSEVSSSSVAPSASSEVVAAGSLPASASSSLAAAASKARKESVEVLRPSALLAAQLDIIHSDDEDEDDSEEEEVEEGGGRGGGSKLGSTSSSKSPSEPRRLPSRSFLANRMGLPVQRSISNRDSREGMNGGDSESGVDSKNTSLADVGAGEVFGSEGEECEGQASDGSSRRNAANSWRRISNVVKNSPDMLLGPGGGGNISSNSAENSPVRDSSESGGDASPFPPSLGSSGKALSSSSSPSKGSTLLRSTLKFMSRGASAQMKSQAQLAADEPKMICHFEDDVIKIPGCHGNSVIKFEIFEGE